MINGGSAIYLKCGIRNKRWLNIKMLWYTAGTAPAKTNLL